MASSQASTSYLASATAAPLPALMASKQHSSPSTPRRRASGRTSPRRSPAGILTSLAVGIVAIAAVLSPRQAQAANFTELTGTWASGSGKVITGLDFFNPISQNFTMPTSGGVSYSFVEDTPGGGHFETSTFTFTSNREYRQQSSAEIRGGASESCPVMAGQRQIGASRCWTQDR